MKDFTPFEKKIGIVFKNKKILEEAFTHRSYLNENPDWSGNQNERLEFFGDGGLGLIGTEALFFKFPDKNEGD